MADGSHGQKVWLIKANSERIAVETPACDALVLPGVRWGNINAPMTPAYWKASAALFPATAARDLRVGESLIDEVAVCLLSGYGIRAEMAYAAYYRLRERGLLKGTPEASRLEAALREPLNVGGRAARYRFPALKAAYLSKCLAAVAAAAPPDDDLALRDWLMRIDGIGPKTASFVVRNWLLSDHVAILDVHVIRAGVHMGLFTRDDHVESMYERMEKRFLEFAKALAVRASILDLMIWAQMRECRFLDAYVRLERVGLPA